MARLDAFFKLMFDTGASDLHIVAGQPPILRVHGELERVKYDPLDDENLRAMLYEIAPEQKIKVFEETGDIDFGYEIPGVARFRANFFMQRVGCGAVFRQIPTKINTADELGLPPILKRTALLNKGLVLVTGPTGSGKSTTLAAIVDRSEEHTSELQSHSFISYAVFCLKKKKKTQNSNTPSPGGSTCVTPPPP